MEGSAFVAAPLAGMTLAQLGAEVIRFDQAGGGPDHSRWPLAPNGESLFWGGLNKGKRSVELDLRSPRGRELATRLITAPGEDAGIFVTNFPARGWLDYEQLTELRSDLIMVALTGNPDGSSEVDYTVHPATGFPMVTGPRNVSDPLNSVLPTWDLLMGHLAVVAVLAAERTRRLTGRGQLVRLALSDVAFATVGHLGRIAEAVLGADQPRKDGNFLYGAFGCDFETRDARRVMIVALTEPQWNALVDATESGDRLAVIERACEEDFHDPGARYRARELIAAVLRPWFSKRTLAEVRAELNGTHVAWSAYQTFRQLVEEDPRCSTANPMFEVGDHPGVGAYPMPRSPLVFSADGTPPVQAPPALGADTAAVLAALRR